MPVRMTQQQFEQLQPGTKPAPLRANRVMRRRDQLPENQIESQILGFLRARGWMVTRRHVGKYVPLGLLLGMLERGPITREMLLRNIVDLGNRDAADWHAERVVARGRNQALELEVKAPGKRPSPGQLQWLREREMLHIPATWADSLDGFAAWYAAQGFDRAR